jgi:hypothetical protein
LQAFLKFLLCFGYCAAISLRIDPHCRAFVMTASQFLLHLEIFAVSAEEDVARQPAENREGVLEILRYVRIRRRLFRCSDQAIAVEDGEAANYNDIQYLTCVVGLHRERGATACVTWRLVRYEHDASEFNRVAIMKRAVDLNGRKAWQRGEIISAPRFGNTIIAVHDHQSRAGLLEDCGRTGEMIEVGLAIQENFGVGPMEAESLDALANERGRRFQICIDEDVAGRGCDEKKARSRLPT